MSWLRIDDKFARHPKIEQLTDRQFRIWIGILCYCAEYRNDGLIYKQAIGRSVSGATPAFLTRCVDLGLLEPTSHANHLQKGSHFQVHDWHKYNGTSDPQAAERMRRYRQQHPRVSGGKWERTREAVFERDGGVCVDCGAVTDDWNADHEPKRADLEAQGISVYDIEFIFTRCHSCHAKKTRREANHETEPTTEPQTEPDRVGSLAVRSPSRARVPSRPKEEEQNPSPSSSSSYVSPLDFNGLLEDRKGRRLR